MTLTDARIPAVPVRSARIDVAAITANARILVARRGSGRVLADLAADGYGHGAAETAKAAIAGGIDRFSVSRVEDAMALDGLPTAEVIVTSGSRAPGSAVESGVAGPELYGLTDDPDLRPAMRVSALVVGVKTIEAGDGVSYGHTFRAVSRTNLALVGIGYADGLDRSASNVASLQVGGIQRRVAGRVAMNVLVVDLGSDTASIGDEAVVFGDPSRGEPGVLSWAASLETSAAEVATAFGSHLPRVFS
jgi:alanine racemase